MRVLVTGATGFIGKEIITELSGADFEVFQIGRKIPADDNRKNLKQNARNNFFQADITDYKSLSKIEKAGNMDAVIHAAGLAHQFKDIEPEKFDSVNVLGTKNVLHLASKLNVRHFILISSTAVYGIKKAPEKERTSEIADLEIDENAACAPETPYAASKLKAESAALEFCAKNGIALTILRLAPVVGEGNVGNTARLIEAIDRKRFIWIGDGQNLKTLIYKKDAARACRKVLTEKKNGTEIFNLASEAVKMNDFVGLIAENLQKQIPKIRIPPFFFKFVPKINSNLFGIKKIDKLNKTIEKWLSDDVYSARSIAEIYDFKPETSMTEAIEKQVAWYKTQKPKQK